MNSVFIKLQLIREKQQFYAGVGLVMTAKELTEKNLLNKLHPKELILYNSYQYDRRKETYLLGRLSAKQAILGLTSVNNEKSIWIDTGVFKFPIVKGAGLQNMKVSISHCDRIGCSIAYPEAHPMGIDIERVDKDRIDIVRSQLAEVEQAVLSNPPFQNAAHFVAVFSIKEALSKVLKTGMMLDFKFLEVEHINIEGQVLFCTFTHFGQYKGVAYLSNNYVFSFVLPKRTEVQWTKVWKMLKELNRL